MKLRITLDAAHPRIAGECAAAIAAVAPGRRAHVYRRRDERAVDVSNYWTHWPCLFPQHGTGPKHRRPIVLADWQRRVAEFDVHCTRASDTQIAVYSEAAVARLDEFVGPTG